VKSKKHWKLRAFEWYAIALILFVPIMSAMAAWREFGQPIFYGMLNQRSVILIVAVLLCMEALRKRFITQNEMKAALLMLAWGTSILWDFIRIALNPTAYANTATLGGFISEGDAPSFVLQGHFIIFGVLYYAFRGLRTGRARNYFLALLLLVGAYGKVSGRQMTFALLLTFLLFMFRWLKLRRLLIVFPTIAMGTVLLVGVLYLVMPQIVTERIGQFQDALVVVLTGEQSEDPSANGRISQVLIALEFIAQRPVFGIGSLSAQWEGGGQLILGTRFYADDIGLIGAVCIYGFFGVILFAGQYVFVLRAMKSLPPKSSSPLLDATKGFILYTILFSLGTGLFVFHVATTLFFVALLCSMADPNLSMDMESTMTGEALANQGSLV
jgi:hypothetical protein